MTTEPLRSLPEVHGSVAVPQAGSWLRRLFAFAGPAYLVSVGYMDPGNWATDLAGGARFGNRLIWVLLMSNLMAVLLQTLSARLGVVSGRDLAQACRAWYPRALVWPLWIICELAIVACDLAEVLGAAIGLQLLFHVPLLAGVFITALDVLLLLALSRFGIRRMEAFIIVLVATIGGCFGVEMLLSRPDVADIVRHLLPRDDLGRLTLFARTPHGAEVLGLRGDALVVAMGILGATVMPHNLYLHSALVQSRAVAASRAGKRQANGMNLVDSAVALNAAFFVNAAILMLAAAVFHTRGLSHVARLEDAHRMLAPLLGTSLASTLFAVALLCSGQSSTITGTLAGQIVMEGFLHLRIRPWLRRLISRSLAVIPAALVIGLRGPGSVDELLVLSQVVLSLQLAFAVVPLIHFTSDRRVMGEFANPIWVQVLAWLAAAIILGLNSKLVIDTLHVWLITTPGAWWLRLFVMPIAAVLTLLITYLVLAPWLGGLARWIPALAPAAPALAPAQARAGVAVARTITDAGPRRIAVALELGPADAAVLEHVHAMPLPADARVVLMHVAESAASRYLGAESSDLEAREDAAALDAIADGLRAHGWRAEVLLGYGDVQAELARMVEAVGADLLVTGSHGHRLLGDLVFGATTSGLRHRVRIPVLTVRSTRPR